MCVCCVLNCRCPAGTYSTAVGASASSTCVACPINTFAKRNGSITCTNCNFGYYTNGTGEPQAADHTVALVWASKLAALAFACAAHLRVRAATTAAASAISSQPVASCISCACVSRCSQKTSLREGLSLHSRHPALALSPTLRLPCTRPNCRHCPQLHGLSCRHQARCDRHIMCGMPSRHMVVTG